MRSYQPQWLPNEILLRVAQFLESGNDRETLASLSETCKSIWATTAALLYRDVIITRPRGLSGLIANFTTDSRTVETNITSMGRARGLYMLKSISHLTLASMPDINRVGASPPTSDWHRVKILAHHHPVLNTMRRLDRLTLTKQAISQLEPMEIEPGSHTEEIIMPSDGLLPAPNDVELAFFPQGALPLKAIIAMMSPRHLILQLPFKPFPAPSEFPMPRNPYNATPQQLHRPHEWVLRQALEGLWGDSRLCVHGIIDQLIPVGHIGATHYISFAAYPTVLPQLALTAGAYPCVSMALRVAQIKDLIRISNPQVPGPETCAESSTSSGSLEQWDGSKIGTWTIYRPGAMVSDGPRRWEWTFGDIIEQRVRHWIRLEFSEENGHPRNLAEGINQRLRFVHCGLHEDPDLLTCEGCGHTCTAKID